MIYCFKGKGQVAAHLLQVAPRQVAVSIITVYELAAGLAKTRAPRLRRTQLEAFLGLVAVLPFERREAPAAASICAELERRGLPIGPLANLIAGTAKAHQATLVTHDASEFSRIPGLRLVDGYA